jgi:RNA polymerase sigma factor (TIGR02999 family)
MSDLGPVTEILHRLASGDAHAMHDLLPMVYDVLRRIAQSQLGGDAQRNAYDATELVHEAFLRLVGTEQIDWRDRAHFFAAAATTIRRFLVDAARARRRQKREGSRQAQPLTELCVPSESKSFDILALEETLERLRELSPRQAQIVELRFFGGLTEHEIAEVLQISRRTVAGDWAMARAWLHRALQT